MAEKGGLVGLNYCAGFLDDQPSPDLCRSTTALMAKHAAHFKQVGGIEIIGLGSDLTHRRQAGTERLLQNALLADALRKEASPRMRWKPSSSATHSVSLKTTCNHRWYLRIC